MGDTGLRRDRYKRGYTGDRQHENAGILREDVAVPRANKSAILEFMVTDVDKDYARAKEFISEIVQEPTTMPWGNRSLLFRDPDGNLVNLFTPVSPEAIKKFGS